MTSQWSQVVNAMMGYLGNTYCIGQAFSDAMSSSDRMIFDGSIDRNMDLYHNLRYREMPQKSVT